MRSQRQLRVGEELRHALASVFLRDEVPWPHGFSPPTVTVTEVQVSPDLKNATVFVMPLGGIQLDETVKTLNNMAGFFRHIIAKNVDMRYAPKLGFKADNSFNYAQRIDEILHDPEVAKDLDKDFDHDDD
ncbi:MAG: 30S ribosome-binding factor RbfA [Alphaproteobacteria bacterium]